MSAEHPRRYAPQTSIVQQVRSVISTTQAHVTHHVRQIQTAQMVKYAIMHLVAVSTQQSFVPPQLAARAERCVTT